MCMRTHRYDFTTSNWNIDGDESLVVEKEDFPDLILVRKVRLFAHLLCVYVLYMPCPVV